MSKLFLITFITAVVIYLTGCSSLGVKPWERRILSQADMQFGSTNLSRTFNQHLYFSREASSGGQGFAGGGCGCN